MGKPFRFLPFQRDILRTALDGDNLATVVSGARGMGKSQLMAVLAVWGLFEREGAQVIIASTGMPTSKIAYQRAVKMIQDSPELSRQCLILTNNTDPFVDQPHRGSTLTPIPAEPQHIVGLAPSLLLADEIGFMNHETFEVAFSALGKQPESVMIGMSTPGLSAVDNDGHQLMWDLREKARSEAPPEGLAYIEYAADPQGDPGDIAQWRAANPGLDALVNPKQIALEYATMGASRFAALRLGLWSQNEEAFIAAADWDALEVTTDPLPDGSTIALGFDGAISGDGTCLVAYDIITSTLHVIGYWVNTEKVRGWKVPRDEVMATIDVMFSRHNVTSLLADPWTFRSEIAELQKRHGERVLEFNTAHASRMAPASDSFRQAVVKSELRWDGSPVMRSHVLAAVAKHTAAGDVLTKDVRKSNRIDTLVSGILAFEAAKTYVPKTDWNIM